MRGDAHVRFGRADQGNDRTARPAPRPGPTPPCRDAGDGGGGEQAGGGQGHPVHGDAGDELDGEQERDRWPGGDELADQVGLGVQDVCDTRSHVVSECVEEVG